MRELFAAAAYAHGTPLGQHVLDLIVPIVLGGFGVTLMVSAIVLAAAVRINWRANRRPGYVDLTRPPFDDLAERRRQRGRGGDHAA